MCTLFGSDFFCLAEEFLGVLCWLCVSGPAFITDPFHGAMYHTVNPLPGVFRCLVLIVRALLPSMWASLCISSQPLGAWCPIMQARVLLTQAALEPAVLLSQPPYDRDHKPVHPYLADIVFCGSLLSGCDFLFSFDGASSFITFVVVCGALVLPREPRSQIIKSL